MAAARAPTTRTRRNGSARRPIAASPTASSTSASSTPAASASNRTSPKSFKWFSLAAAQGDADSVRKRDDIAKRLDAQSLAAAKLAIQTFTPEPQPDDAVNVASPAGGWDTAPVQAGAAKARRQAGCDQARFRRART